MRPETLRQAAAILRQLVAEHGKTLNERNVAEEAVPILADIIGQGAFSEPKWAGFKDRLRAARYPKCGGQYHLSALHAALDWLSRNPAILLSSCPKIPERERVVITDWFARRRQRRSGTQAEKAAEDRRREAEVKQREARTHDRLRCVIEVFAQLIEAEAPSVEARALDRRPPDPGADLPATRLADFIPVAEVVRVVGRKAGRSDKLAEKMQRRGYQVDKKANKWHCQREDAIRMFPRFKERIKEICVSPKYRE